VNDGSPDTEMLEQVLTPFLASIRYIKQENGGPSAARTRGIQEARGKYVAFLDSDDSWLPNHLARQIELLSSDSSLALVYSNALVLQGDVPIGTAFERVPQDLHVNFETLVTERCTIGTSTVVAVRRALLEVGGFEDRRRRSEDFDLWLRMAHRGLKMSYSDSVQVRHRAGNGLAMDDNVMRKAQIDVYEKALLNLPITGAQADLLCNKTQQLHARLQIEAAKKSLRQSRFPEALASVRLANLAHKSAKLLFAILGLRFFPRVFAATYGVYERLLKRRVSRQSVHFLTDANSDGNKPGAPGS
jgi:glycosyltransferase involved in cell wall biosynthesis